MAQDNSNSTMEMGTSDQVLVAAKKKKRLTFILGFGAMLVILAVVITLVVVLPGNDSGTPEAIESTTTEGPTTPTTITSPSITPTDPDITTPGDTTPAATTPEATTPEATTPEATTPEVTTPEATTPEATTPEATTPEPTTTPPPTDPPIPELDLEGVLGDAYTPSLFDGSWASDGNVIMRNDNGDLVMFDLEANETRTLVSNSTEVLEPSPRVMQLSPNGEEVALSFNAAPLFRHSFLAEYAAVNVTEGTVTRILPPGVTRNTDALLQNFVWGPSGTALAFVYLNNIYYQSSLAELPRQITSTGEVNVIYNGIPDWVYEEEVFSSNNAMWFSPDGSKLSYVTFNDTDVRIMKVPHYGVPGSILYQYTQHHEIHYPKSGTTNPIATVTIHDLSDNQYTTFEAPEDLNEPIVKPPVFVNNETVAVMWTNRVQNTTVVELCTLLSNCQRIYEYTETNGWIDNIPMIFNAEGNAFITILPAAVNGVRYKQIIQVSQEAGQLWISQNRINFAHTVISILRWTSDDVIWYKATSDTDSAEQHIYSVQAGGPVSCFTCDLHPETKCRYNDADMSQNGELININCLGPNIPRVDIYNTSGVLITSWADNAQLASDLEEVQMPLTIRERVPIVDGLPDADVHIQVPANYLERDDRIPLLVYVYGGPDRGLVTKEWVLDWGTSLVNRYGIAVARIDGRGSGLRGIDTMFSVNRHLGTFEIEDQINVTRQLHERLPWLDSNRTCIWGWSYGGYASSLALARGDGVFRCAAAVAPVVDWHFYDTIYTERFMDIPANNPDGYQQSSLLTEEAVESFRDKRYFLIHGTADDNVHYQHAMLLSRRLQRADIYFHQMSYTDEDHGLSGVWKHLYHALEKFLRENLL